MPLTLTTPNAFFTYQGSDNNGNIVFSINDLSPLIRTRINEIYTVTDEVLPVANRIISWTPAVGGELTALTPGKTYAIKSDALTTNPLNLPFITTNAVGGWKISQKHQFYTYSNYPSAGSIRLSQIENNTKPKLKAIRTVAGPTNFGINVADKRTNLFSSPVPFSSMFANKTYLMFAADGVTDPFNIFPVPTPVYTLVADKSVVNEDANIVTFTLSSSPAEATARTKVPYVIFGTNITAEDFQTPLTGIFDLDDNGVGRISVITEADEFTENATEVFTLSTSVNATANVTIFDTSKTPIPFYKVYPNVSSVNEGSTVTFIFSSIPTSITAGDQVTYQLYGNNITDGDLIDPSQRSGSFVLDSNGEYRLDVDIKPDFITETNETLILSASIYDDNNNKVVIKSTSVVINDSSKTPEPVFTLTSNKNAISEKEIVTYTLSSFPAAAAGRIIPYRAYGSGINAQDFVATAGASAPLIGNFVIDSTGISRIQFETREDFTTELTETLILSTAVTTPPLSVTIYDTSTTPPPTYVLTSNVPEVDEGSNVVFQLSSSPIITTANTRVPYTITGITFDDLKVGSVDNLVGDFVLNNAGIGWVTIPVGADFKTEGIEYIIISTNVTTPPLSVKVNDTSVGQEYSLSASALTINEGQTVTFVLSSNMPMGTVPYTITLGNSPYVNLADFSVGNSSGTFNIGPNRRSQLVQFTLRSDLTTEGDEYLVINTTKTPSLSVKINDTSKAAAYSLSASALTINEGQTVNFILSAFPAPPVGTKFPYVIASGINAINAADLTAGTFSGNFTMQANGRSALVPFTLRNDTFTEGTEVLTLSTVGNTALSVNINDTSLTPSYTLSASTVTVNEGQSVRFVLISNPPAAVGTVIPYRLININL